MNDLWLTDEDIWGKEPSSEEQRLEEENNKLKERLILNEEKIEVMRKVLNNINSIVKSNITRNISKTRVESNIPLIKRYREELLVLRELEKQLQIYLDYTGD